MRRGVLGKGEGQEPPPPKFGKRVKKIGGKGEGNGCKNGNAKI